jgi:hypothetical protein
MIGTRQPQLKDEPDAAIGRDRDRDSSGASPSAVIAGEERVGAMSLSGSAARAASSGRSHPAVEGDLYERWVRTVRASLLQSGSENPLSSRHRFSQALRRDLKLTRQDALISYVLSHPSLQLLAPLGDELVNEYVALFVEQFDLNRNDTTSTRELMDFLFYPDGVRELGLLIQIVREVSPSPSSIVHPECSPMLWRPAPSHACLTGFRPRVEREEAIHLRPEQRGRPVRRHDSPGQGGADPSVALCIVLLCWPL